MKIPVFKEYLSEEEVQAGLLDKTLTQGVIRVNQRNFEQCFVDNPDGEELGDLLVLGFEDRNRALHGDLVAIRVKPREAWFLNEMQCKRHNVKCIPRAPPPAALVASPSAVVATEGSGGSSPPSTKPKSKKDQQQQKQLIQPPLKSFRTTGGCRFLTQMSGAQILIVVQEELGRRRDFRDDVVFTIDPLTARDLDDALHIKQICRKKDDGRDGGMCWEVGVHIADVSYFLRQDTELDDWACKRGTSVYLVHQVIPMLPRILCEELCSLNPGVDRLTFSVVWHMDNDANIFHTTFCRSIIRSCAKLAYEHAQDIIDNPTKQFAIAEMPPIHCGRKIRDIKQAVRNLDAIARKLKAKRFGKGALKLELPKLRFDVEKSSTGIWQPRGIRLDERKDANFLVEEFMLLANMYVAHQTYDYFKTSALLRRHPPPKKKELKNLVDKCGKLGIHINPLSSKTLADSLKTYEHMEECKYGVMPALNQMLMKCMHLAQYFCTGLAESEHEFRHYALSVDFYTHFTSPIRRYPDVIVHRLLAASLGYCPSPGYSTEAINKIASRSNNTKTSAKTLNMMSIVQVRLVPIKDSVKYEVNLVPTPDVRSLNWHDAREHMEV
uniref:RNB domain-containing protein n=1 Tax=Globodera pallida TaxID=36090 RepID=A0A183CG04_GLOPA